MYTHTLLYHSIWITEPHRQPANIISYTFSFLTKLSSLWQASVGPFYRWCFQSIEFDQIMWIEYTIDQTNSFTLICLFTEFILEGISIKCYIVTANMGEHFSLLRDILTLPTILPCTCCGKKTFIIGYMVTCTTHLIHGWYFRCITCADLVYRTCNLLYTYYNFISTHVIHM